MERAQWLTVRGVLAGRTIGGPASARMVIDGREYVNFFGSGYLALSDVPEIRAAVQRALELSAAASAASLAYIASHPELRRGLQVLSQYLRARLRELGVSVIESPAPIVSFQWGTRADMLVLQGRLWERGIHVYHSTYVGAGAEGVIRCAVFANHSREDIDMLIGALRELG